MLLISCAKGTGGHRTGTGQKTPRNPNQDGTCPLGLAKWLGWGNCFLLNQAFWLPTLDKVSPDVIALGCDIIYSLRQILGILKPYLKIGLYFFQIVNSLSLALLILKNIQIFT